MICRFSVLSFVSHLRWEKIGLVEDRPLNRCYEQIDAIGYSLGFKDTAPEWSSVKLQALFEEHRNGIRRLGDVPDSCDHCSIPAVNPVLAKMFVIARKNVRETGIGKAVERIGFALSRKDPQRSVWSRFTGRNR